MANINRIEALGAKAESVVGRVPLWLLGAISAIGGVALLVGFVLALAASKAGEVAGALGSVIGGIVGAGGAVWAVFLMLLRQRKEEMAKVTEAVTIEVIGYAKYVVGALNTCRRISSGAVKMPRQDVGSIVESLVADPVIYPAIADTVGLLPHPNSTTEFYMRLSEAKSMVEVLRTKTNPQGITYVSPPVEYVTPEFAALLADSLITALQLARVIIADGSPRSVTAR